MRRKCSAEPVPRRYARLMSYFTPEQKLALYSGALRDQLADVDSYELLDQAFEESRARSDVCRLMDVDVQTYLPGDLLPKVDITTMACSLEARSPFLDHHLMEWAAGLPGPAQGPIADHEIPAEASDDALVAKRSRLPGGSKASASRLPRGCVRNSGICPGMC